MQMLVCVNNMISRKDISRWSSGKLFMKLGRVIRSFPDKLKSVILHSTVRNVIHSTLKTALDFVRSGCPSKFTPLWDSEIFRAVAENLGARSPTHRTCQMPNVMCSLCQMTVLLNYRQTNWFIQRFVWKSTLKTKCTAIAR